MPARNGRCSLVFLGGHAARSRCGGYVSVEIELPIAVGILATAITVVSAALGFLFDERNAQSAIMLGGYAAVAGMICTLGALAGRWPGLLVAVVVVAVLAFRVAAGMGNRQGGFFAVGLWLGLCLSCAVGYWGGGWLGLLLITVPIWVLFWGSLFFIAHMLLPLRHREGKIGPYVLPRGLRPMEKRGDKGRAFRSLVTFSLGTNYPYLALENDEMVERVKGKLAGRFLGGPGIVLTGPAHAPALWTGTEFTQVGEPGVTFTNLLERVFQTLDLRPQLRTFYVKAMTRDGIRVRAQVFCPFQLDAGRKSPALGQAFPRRRKAIHAAFQQQTVEHGRRVTWDEGVTVAATRILRNLLAEYTFDQLAEVPEPWKEEQEKKRKRDTKSLEAKDGQAQEPGLTKEGKSEDQVQAESPAARENSSYRLEQIVNELTETLSAPEDERAQLTQSLDQIAESPATREDVRAQIAQRLERQLAEEWQPLGIHILGVGLGALEPVDRSLIEKRVEAWRAHWERRILVTEGQTRGQEIDEMEAAYLRAQFDLLRPVAEILDKHTDANTDLLSELVALRFIGALEEMAQQPEIQAALPNSTTETLAHLRRRLRQE